MKAAGAKPDVVSIRNPNATCYYRHDEAKDGGGLRKLIQSARGEEVGLKRDMAKNKQKNKKHPRQEAFEGEILSLSGSGHHIT